MSLIKGTSVSYTYSGCVSPVFSNLDFCISSESKIGLVGRNGCGKTTLLKLISGMLPDFSGEILNFCSNIGVLSQETSWKEGITAEEAIYSALPNLFPIREKIRMLENGRNLESETISLAQLYNDYNDHDGFAIEAKLQKLSHEFGFSETHLKLPANKLSGGEKTKLNLIGLLLKSPDLLLLDEPTNHLDISALKWLEEFLAQLRIPFLTISHDRYFLDQSCRSIWELKNGSITEYSGNYSFYKRQKQQTLEKQMEKAQQNVKKINRLQSSAREVRTTANKMENFKAKRSIAKNGRICKRDDGSGKAVRIQNKQKAANVMEKRIDREIEKAEACKPFIEKKRSILFGENRLKNNCVLRVNQLCKAYAAPILTDIDFALGNGRHLAICGPNGSGKTTLLRILAGIENSDKGSISWAPQASIGYYAQEFEQLNPDSSILGEVLQGDLANQTRARTILGCLKIEKDMVNQQIKSLSVGEKSKTALARILFSNPDVLILDEPTNHLEIEARESLEDALEHFSGTIIFVSHDRYFTERFADEQVILV